MHFAGVFSHWSWKLCSNIKNWAITKSTAMYTRGTGTTWIIPFTSCFNSLSRTQRIFTYLNPILGSNRRWDVQWRARPVLVVTNCSEVRMEMRGWASAAPGWTGQPGAAAGTATLCDVGEAALPLPGVSAQHEVGPSTETWLNLYRTHSQLS